MSFDFLHFFSTDSFELGQEHSEYMSYVHRSHLGAKIRDKKLNSSPTWTEHGVIELCELIFLLYHNLMYNLSNYTIYDQSIENIKLSRSVKLKCFQHVYSYCRRFVKTAYLAGSTISHNFVYV